jgi:hypothetical protein
MISKQRSKREDFKDKEAKMGEKGRLLRNRIMNKSKTNRSPIRKEILKLWRRLRNKSNDNIFIYSFN